MRLFARLEVNVDDSDDHPNIERIVSGDVDMALWLREVIGRVADEHGEAWEAELHIEPLTREEL